MLANNALTTIDRVKAVLTLDMADTSKDAVLSMFINSASDFIESYTGRTFGIGSYTDKKIGAVPNTIILQNTPVQAVASVNADGSPLSADLYEVDLYLGTVLNPHGWSLGWALNNPYPKLEINYTAGYVLPKDDTPENPRTLPYDLEMVCIELAAKSYNRMTNQAEGKKSETQGSWSVSYEPNDLTPQQTLVLNKYMRLV